MRPRDLATTALLWILASPCFAGGALECVDITGREIIFGDTVVARTLPMRWDSRCIPVELRLNDTLDPIPNPLGPSFLTLEEALPVLGASLETWNAVDTSFISMGIVGSTGNPGTQRFDMIHEITFRTPPEFDLIASSETIALMEDEQLSAGTDIDGDGDSDVASGIETCRDVDGDGDIELPEGFYRAGTILDSDIQFNTKTSNGFRFTVTDEDLDTDERSIDLQAVATHEAGHTHGLAHSLSNQISSRDGTQVTMFPFIDPDDPADQLAVRSLEIEDVATSSFFYPEGSAASGPAALQPGDVAFDQVFGLLEGEAFHGEQGQPLAGGSVFAVDAFTGEVVGSAITGTTRYGFDLRDDSLRVFRGLRSFHLLDGRWAIPVPYGTYLVGIAGVDDEPVDFDEVNLTTLLGGLLGQSDFPEEMFNRGGETDLEARPGFAVPIPVRATGDAGKNLELVTNRVHRLRSFQERSDSEEIPPGTFFAVEIPASQIALATGGRPFEVVAGLFNTLLKDRSIVPVFAQALLASGLVDPDGTASLDLSDPLARVAPFVGRDHDDAPLYFHPSQGLGATLKERIDRGEIESVFLVLEGPPSETPTGPTGTAPFIGVDRSPPISGRSFISEDGVTFHRDPTQDFLFELLLSELPETSP